MGKKKENRTYIGGQAVLEGVMMRGKTAYATAVRDPEGHIQVESRRLNTSKAMKRVNKIPLVRGVVSFVSSLVTGSKILMRSAAVYGDEGEPSKFEKWCQEKLHLNVMSAVSFVATLIGVLLAVGLFVALPMFLSNLFFPEETGLRYGIGYNLVQGGLRLLIFLIYIVAITAMKDIRRVFMYHGAEHKTITCFERGMELTPENAKTCSRLHDRCGTTFLFLVMAISIVVFSVVNWICDAYLNLFVYNEVANYFIQFAIKILFLPLVAGISYEVLKLLAKSQSKWLIPLKAPGFALQLLTTREPTEDMLEVAIAAFRKDAALDADPSMPEESFVVSRTVKNYVQELKERFAEKDIDASDAEWLVSLRSGVPRSELASSDKLLVPSAVRWMRLQKSGSKGGPFGISSAVPIFTAARSRQTSGHSSPGRKRNFWRNSPSKRQRKGTLSSICVRAAAASPSPSQNIVPIGTFRSRRRTRAQRRSRWQRRTPQRTARK